MNKVYLSKLLKKRFKWLLYKVRKNQMLVISKKIKIKCEIFSIQKF